MTGYAHKNGGPQEEGRRAGTENVAGVLAMIAALADGEAARRLALRVAFEKTTRA